MFRNYLSDPLAYRSRNRKSRKTKSYRSDIEEQYRVLKALTYTLNVIESFPPDLWDSTFFHRTLPLLADSAIYEFIEWAIGNYGIKKCARNYPSDFNYEIKNRKVQLPIRELAEMFSMLARSDVRFLQAYTQILKREKESCETISYDSSFFKKNLKRFQKLFSLLSKNALKQAIRDDKIK